MIEILINFFFIFFFILFSRDIVNTVTTKNKNIIFKVSFIFLVVILIFIFDLQKFYFYYLFFFLIYILFLVYRKYFIFNFFSKNNLDSFLVFFFSLCLLLFELELYDRYIEKIVDEQSVKIVNFNLFNYFYESWVYKVRILTILLTKFFALLTFKKAFFITYFIFNIFTFYFIIKFIKLFENNYFKILFILVSVTLYLTISNLHNIFFANSSLLIGIFVSLFYCHLKKKNLSLCIIAFTFSFERADCVIAILAAILLIKFYHQITKFNSFKNLQKNFITAQNFFYLILIFLCLFVHTILFYKVNSFVYFYKLSRWSCFYDLLCNVSRENFYAIKRVLLLFFPLILLYFYNRNKNYLLNNLFISLSITWGFTALALGDISEFRLYSIFYFILILNGLVKKTYVK